MTRNVDEAVSFAGSRDRPDPAAGTLAASIEVGRPRTRTDTRSSERVLAVRGEVHRVITRTRR